MINRIHVSESETQYKEKFIYSFYPIDKYDCQCQRSIMETSMKLSTMSPNQVIAYKNLVGAVHCPKQKDGYHFYKLFCNNCHEQVADCFSKDDTLTDYFDLHYICRHDGKFWQGALAINISPVDGMIGIECCCGNDTRDFRLNNSLSEADKLLKIAENMKGREWGKLSSKFLATRS